MTADVRDQLQASLGSDYTIERELGGGMSRVFLAHETRLGRKVVIKVLNPDLAAAVSAERFERETRVAAQLQDPRIVPVLSAGVAGGLPYYTMPFVEGESLRARMSRERLSPDEAVAILRDVALALEHAHARGIVHRDIKPENILLANNTAVVTDFGIAKAIAKATDTAAFNTLTQQGASLGTPAYMAPEQALGDERVDHRADIYAWGMVAYEMLAGAHPFGGKSSSQAMVAAQISETPPTLATRARALPSHLSALVDRALRKEPNERPASASELVRGLDGALPRARGVSVSAPLRWKWPTWVGVGVAVAVAGVAALTRSRGQEGSEVGATAVRSIAVMPFVALGGDTSDAYLGQGISDALSTTLAKLPNLRIVAPRSGQLRDTRSGGRALNVDAVLEGNVQRDQGQFRVRARLTRVADGSVIWGENYDRRAPNVFALENDVTAAIATGLRGRLSGERASLAAGEPRGTDDLEAYNLFLRGRYAWSKRGETSLRTAIDLFNQALTRDPSFARAHAGLAMAYVVLPVFTTSMSADSATGMAMRSANRALAIDSTLADAHLALAYAHKMRWQWSDAERHFRAAASLAPDAAGVHHWYGVYLYAVGEVERSAQELSRARELDPFMATIGTDHAVALYGARRFDEARAEVHRAFVLDTTKSDTWFMAGLIQLAQGRPDSALVSLETARRRGTGFDATP
ncbi:MAG TPA: protein kinase, partial [Gemmatimonadaceae bacterium]|nr:protein kinase [Gemmatimonadaceae bacterium]